MPLSGKRGHIGLLLVVLLVAQTISCAHRTQPPSGEVSGRPPVPKQAPPAEGGVAIRFLADPSPATMKLPETQEFAPATAWSMPVPAFPTVALVEGLPVYTIAVRILVSDSGAVYGVVDSPKLSSTSGQFTAAFREAVEAAVRRWAFSAARVDTVGERLPGQSPSDPAPLLSSRYVPTFLDFAFEFRVSEGRGVVSVAPSSVNKP